MNPSATPRRAAKRGRDADHPSRALPPIVCFANDWHGDPTSKHHIMRAYARETDVLWVESSGMRTPKLAKSADLGRIVARVKKSFGGLRQAEDRLHVLSPLSVPLPASAAARRLNRRLYRVSVRRALREIGVREKPLLWVYTPTVAPYLSGMPRAGLVYHCVDRWWAFSEYDSTVMRDCHASLCREADVVFASARELVPDCRAHSKDVHLIRHGVDWEHFSRAALDAPPRPSDIAGLTGPVLGFFGLIHEWVDQALLCRLADAFPEATLVLIGKAQVDVARLRSRPNIRLLGQKPYAELPAYGAAFDVALIPFVNNDLTVAVNPIKLREYLSAGLPVVATALPEIERMTDNPMVRTGRTPDEQIAAVRSLLADPVSPETRKVAALRMRDESWAGRCAAMSRLISA